MIQNYFDNAKRILGSLISNAHAQKNWNKGIYLFSFLKIIGSPTKLAMRAKRWAGQSAKSSGFCSKKVLTSSSRHHHTELAASLGASPLASAGSFASKSKGFLKSIESFCWLIWRFANLKSLLVPLWRNKTDFILSPLAKGKTRFY